MDVARDIYGNVLGDAGAIFPPVDLGKNPSLNESIKYYDRYYSFFLNTANSSHSNPYLLRKDDFYLKMAEKNLRMSIRYRFKKILKDYC